MCLWIFILVSCSSLFAENEKLKVFVSILPQKYFAERLLENNGTVEVLIGPGMSPHTFEPLPQQMGKLSRSDLFFTVGIPFEKVIISRIKDLCPNLLIIATDENIATTVDVGLKTDETARCNIIAVGELLTEEEAETVVEAGIELKKAFINYNNA